jgi:branched-chain amino acid transport system substrate-binding protein
MLRKLLVPLTVVLLASLILTGCPRQAAESIKIGLQAPITGEYAYEGEGFVKCVELITNQINDAGGILNGRKIEIVKCDDVGKPDESSKCANQLVSAGVSAVVGSYSSTCTEPASEIYNEAGILQITPSSTATRLSQKGFQRFFRVCFLDDRQGLFAANFMNEKLQAKKVGIIHDSSTYAQGLAEHTKRYAEEAGLEVVIFDAINPEDTDFKPILTKIAGLEPDAVYFTGYHPQGGLLLKQSKELGTEFQWVMGNACNNPEMVEIAGLDAAKGTYITTEPLPKDIPGEAAQKFYNDFVDKYGEPPASVWWVMSADALNVIVEAMKATNSTDSEKMAEYLHNEFKDYPGVTGNIIGFDEKGDRLGTVHEAYIITDSGEFELFK